MPYTRWQCKVLEMTLNVKLNSKLVLNAFLHYDALCSHDYRFNYSICGYHPHTVVMDLNRKVSFRCSADPCVFQLSISKILLTMTKWTAKSSGRMSNCLWSSVASPVSTFPSSTFNQIC